MGSLFGLEALCTPPRDNNKNVSASTKRARKRRDQELMNETPEHLTPLEIEATTTFKLETRQDLSSILSNVVVLLRSLVVYDIDGAIQAALPDKDNEDNDSTTISLAADGWKFPTGRAPVSIPLSRAHNTTPNINRSHRSSTRWWPSRIALSATLLPSQLWMRVTRRQFGYSFMSTKDSKLASALFWNTLATPPTKRPSPGREP